MIWISTSDRMPPAGKYVLARHNRGTWVDETDQANVNCVVVRLSYGISEITRSKMEESDRERTHTEDDEGFNNEVAYSWHVCSPDHFYGQEITHWMKIPKFDK